MGGVLLALVGCSGDATPTTDPASARSPQAPEVSTAPGGAVDLPQASPDMVERVRRALAQRSVAVTGGDVTAFRAGLVAGDPSFRAEQERYLDNLRQLPLQVFALVPDPATLVRDGSAPGADSSWVRYWVNVRVTVQLAGYDAVPVTTVDRYLFTAAATGGRPRLASVTDSDWEDRNRVRAQPWDTGPVVVRAGAGVLGVFDPASVSAADRLLPSIERGIAAVSALVPYPWSRTVVVYALSDDTFLRSVPDLPGRDPGELDAVAFPVLADASIAGEAAPAPDPAALAGTRLVLSPAVLSRNGRGRARLLRHELTHAAVGASDDHAPVWLSEGLAEYVSVQVGAPERRRIQPEALAAARSGFTRLPTERGFNDQGAAADYGQAWWVCEYVAATAGPAAVWAVLDQLENLGAQSPRGVADAAQQGDVLLAVTGLDARTVARRSGRLLVRTFAPPPTQAPAAVPLAPPMASATP